MPWGSWPESRVQGSVGPEVGLMGLEHVSQETSSFCQGTEFLGPKPGSNLLGRFPSTRVSQPWHWTSWDGRLLVSSNECLWGILLPPGHSRIVSIPGLHPQKARTTSHSCDNQRWFPHSQMCPTGKTAPVGNKASKFRAPQGNLGGYH